MDHPGRTQKSQAAPEKELKAYACELEQKLESRTRELAEALERQAATSDVLRVISSSPGELRPVFEAMLANATRLCEAKFGSLLLYDDRGFRVVALHDAPPAYVELRQREPFIRPRPEHPLGRIANTKQVVHVPDTATLPEHARARLVDIAGARTIVSVPMLKEGELIGAIDIYRQEVRPFTQKQIELVQNFAHQAVIAIENARLLNELRQRTDELSEALEQQTATSEVLQVISSSPGELKPVFEAMLANAVRICNANFGNLFLYEGNSFRIAAQRNAPPAYAERWRQNPVLMVDDNPHNPLARLVKTGDVVNIPDLAAESAYLERDPRFVALVEGAGARTHLLVPMLREDKLIGAVAIYHQQVHPFTDKEIELVGNFAKQCHETHVPTATEARVHHADRRRRRVALALPYTSRTHRSTPAATMPALPKMDLQRAADSSLFSTRSWKLPRGSLALVVRLVLLAEWVLSGLDLLPCQSERRESWAALFPLIPLSLRLLLLLIAAHLSLSHGLPPAA